MKTALFKHKIVRVLVHVLVWVLFFSLPSLLRSYDHEQPQKRPDDNFQWLSLCSNVLWVGLFYLNAYVYTPSFIYKRRYLQYVLLQVLTAVVVGVMHWSLFQLLITKEPFNTARFIGFSIFPFFLMVTAGTTYQLIRDKTRADQLKQQQQQENLKTELSFLRSQISPHFMFNVLNNMVALVRLQSEELEPTIFKLSSLMRYMLYEADEEKVLLGKEIEYLQSYIDLQQQRVGSKVQLDIVMQPVDESLEIAPMLLIPFIENAFKHGVGNIAAPCIRVRLHTEGSRLLFTVRNKYHPFPGEIKDKTSGIGLVNVKRRLNLLYGDHHTLQIRQDEQWFDVSLAITVHHAAMYSS
jgi:sensor histidine kinase YesM